VDRQPVVLPGHTIHPLDWIVVGGESGPLRDTERQRAARPMALEWAENIVAQTHGRHARVHVKQLGRVLAHKMGIRGDGKKLDDLPPHMRIREFPTHTNVW
jgi:protein gp37